MRSTRLPFHLAALAAACIPAIAATRPLAGQRAGAEAYRETIPGTLVSFEMVPVPEGTVDGIAVKPFHIGRTEVTWDMYDVFALGSTWRRRRPARTPSRVHRSLTEHPITAGDTRAFPPSASRGTRPKHSAHGFRRKRDASIDCPPKRNGRTLRTSPRARHALSSAQRDAIAWHNGNVIGTDACSRRAKV